MSKTNAKNIIAIPCKLTCDGSNGRAMGEWIGTLRFDVSALVTSSTDHNGDEWTYAARSWRIAWQTKHRSHIADIDGDTVTVIVPRPGDRGTVTTADIRREMATMSVDELETMIAERRAAE